MIVSNNRTKLTIIRELPWPDNYNYTGKFDGIWPFTKDCQISKIKFSGGHNVIAVDKIKLPNMAHSPNFVVRYMNSLLIFRLAEVIAMVAQLYLLPASFWQNDMS